MNIIFIGDPHFKTDNFTEVDIFVNKLYELLSKHKVDYIIIGGDLLHYHERLHTMCLNKATEFINKLRKFAQLYVLVGNHDYCNNQQFLTTNHWMNSIKEWEGVTIVDHPIKVDNWIMCPYVPNGRFIEAIDKIDNWKDCVCIFAHQEFKGCKMGAIISEHGDEWKKEYPLVVSGHIHDKQWVGDNVFYTGSAMQHAFGEDGRKIIASININEKEYEITEHSLDLPKKKIIYLDVSDIEDYKIKETKNKIKLSVSGTYDQFKTFKKSSAYKNILDKGIKIVYKAKKETKKEKEEVGCNDFDLILYNLIFKEQNPILTKIYNKIKS